MEFMLMAENDVTEIHQKLDRLVEMAIESKTKIGNIEVHLEKLNSKVASHEGRFVKVYEDFNKKVDKCKKEEEVRDEGIKKDLVDLKIKFVALATFLGAGTGVATNFVLSFIHL